MKNKLTRQLALDVTLAIFIGMLVYALFQFSLGEAQPDELWLPLLWQSLLLGLLVYCVLLIRLRSRVLRPLDLLFFQAKDISRGVLQECKYPTTHNEIDQVTEMMNHMVRSVATIKNTCWKDHAMNIQRHIKGLQQHDDIPTHAKEEFQEILDTLRKLELTIMVFEETPDLAIKSYGKVRKSATLSQPHPHQPTFMERLCGNQ